MVFVAAKLGGTHWSAGTVPMDCSTRFQSSSTERGAMLVFPRFSVTEPSALRAGAGKSLVEGSPWE
ncbi:hypothetical protein D3C87_1521200 [compost metagenome]